MEQLRDFDIGYIMGLVVGEGSFTHDLPNRRQVRPVLSVKLTAEDRAPLDFIAALLGGKVYGPYGPHGKTPGNRKPYCVWTLRGSKLLTAIPLFIRHLPPSRKREQLNAWLMRHFPVGLGGGRGTGRAAKR
jgi:hypothetical protein